jgi:exonuclease SbcC
MIPISLSLKNFFSHKESFIDFENFSSALLIGNIDGDYYRSNGSGKTAVFEAILWVLFNKARVAIVDDVILWGETTCCVEFKFQHNGTTYFIKRNRNRISGTSNIEFYMIAEDGGLIDISGSTAKLTNEKIVSILKFDYKTFVNSAYFRQNDISEFALADPSRKKEILKSIIDISKWDDYERESKIKLKNLKQESDILRLRVEDLEKIEIDLSIQNNRLKSEESNREELLSQKDILTSQYENLSSKYQEMKNNLDTNTWDSIIEENNKLTKNINSLSSETISTSKSLKDDRDKLISYEKERDVLLEKNKNIDISLDFTQDIEKVEEELISFKSQFETSKIMFNKLKTESIHEGTCNVCGQDISTHLYESLHEKKVSSLDEYRKSGIYAKNKISELELKQKALVEQKNNIDKAKVNIIRINLLLDNINAMRMSIKEKEDKLSKYSKEKNDCESKIANNLQILESIKSDDFQAIHKDLLSLKKDISNKENLIGDSNKNIGILSEKIKNLQKSVNTLTNDKNTLVAFSNKINVYEKMTKLFGKNGIQVILLNAIIEDLEKTSNKILSEICNESIFIVLETQRLGADGQSMIDTLDLKVHKDGMNQNFKSLSGGEQFRISLALRIALSEISSRHGGSLLEFLLLDEINSPLDKDGTESLFLNVISALEKKYKILVITHDDYLKERFINILDVTKVNGESTVSFYQK